MQSLFELPIKSNERKKLTRIILTEANATTKSKVQNRPRVWGKSTFLVEGGVGKLGGGE